MINVTKQQLWQFLTINACSDPNQTYDDYAMEVDEDQPAEFAISQDQFIALRDAQRDEELVCILAEQGFSETHPGGDTVIDIAELVVKAIANGLSIVMWYGDAAECLIAAYRRHRINVV